MNNSRWSEKDNEFFIENYHTMNNLELSKRLNRTISSLVGRAMIMGVKKSHIFRRMSDCSILLNDSLESMYWIGFILADGSISNKYRLTIALSAKDLEHLTLFSNYIKCPIKSYDSGNGYSIVEIRVQDIDNIKSLVEKYKIAPNKTINPPNIKSLSLTNEQMMALFIGFIDGDGSLSKARLSINIKNHLSWLDNLQTFSNLVKNFLKIDSRMEPRIVKPGYAALSITHSKLVQGMKRFAIEHNLPVMGRKWNPIP